MLISEKLKKSILQAAIQGKLTEQLPSDGSAKTLLAKIKAEKQKLIAEGKIKKEKPLAPITDDEKPFEIPENWEWVKFGEAFVIGSAIRVLEADWRSSGVPFYRAREIAKLSDIGTVDNELFIDRSLFEALKKKSYVPRQGDFMVTGVGTLGKTYIVKEQDEFYYKDASVLCVMNMGAAIPQFFKYVMETQLIRDQINSNSSGTTVATLTISRYCDYIFPLPPLAEQKRIVARVEELFAEIEKLEKDEQKLDDLQKTFPSKLKNSLLQAAMQGKLTEQLPSDGNAKDLLAKIKKTSINDDDKLFNIPENWEWIKLCDVVNISTGKKDANYGTPNGHFLVRRACSVT